MKSKRSILLCLALVLSMAMAMGSTLAYLQDSDSDVNVMTLGNVTIDQIEEFEQGTAIYPNTEVKKEVTVKNTGKSDAYFRTLIAIENLPESETFEVGVDVSSIMAHYTSYFESTEWAGWPGGIDFELDGKHYELWAVTYNKALAPGETSEPSLLKVEMGKACTNEDMAALGSSFDILVLSQAVQTAGFDNARTALDEAFGPVTAEKAKEWFSGEEFAIPVMVSNAQELGAALEAGGYVILAENIEWTMAEDFEQNKEVTLDLNGKTITMVSSARQCWKVNAPLEVKDSVGGGEIYSRAGSQFKVYDEMTVTGGSINLAQGAVIVYNDATMNVSGETARIYSENGTGIKAHSNLRHEGEQGVATINVTAGTISGYSVAISTENGRKSALNISGGTIESRGRASDACGVKIQQDAVVKVSGSPEITVTTGKPGLLLGGGVLDMSDLAGDGEYTITQTGGTFIAPSAEVWDVSSEGTDTIHITPKAN